MKRHSSNHSGSNTRLPGKEELIALSAKAAAEAGELSLSRLALNIPTLLYAEDGEEGAAERIFSGLREPVREIALAVSGHGEIPAEAKEKVFALREENTEKMRQLSVYADRFVIDEYILNRLEHRFDYFALPEDYSDEAFAGQILEALSAQKDQTARQPLLLAVLEQPLDKRLVFQVRQGAKEEVALDGRLGGQLLQLLADVGIGGEVQGEIFSPALHKEGLALVKEQHARAGELAKQGHHLTQAGKVQMLLAEPLAIKEDLTAIARHAGGAADSISPKEARNPAGVAPRCHAHMDARFDGLVEGRDRARGNLRLAIGKDGAVDIGEDELDAVHVLPFVRGDGKHCTPGRPTPTGVNAERQRALQCRAAHHLRIGPRHARHQNL